MFLLILVYWYSAELYLIDSTVAELSPTVAVAIAAAFIVGGWFVYDLLCRSPLGRNEQAFSVVLLVIVSLLAWGLCQLFSGRGAYIHCDGRHRPTFAASNRPSHRSRLPRCPWPVSTSL